MNKTENTFNENNSLDISFDQITFDDVKFDDIDDVKEERFDDPQRELSEEIKSFREKQKEFAATNDKETYLVVVFSTKEDKETFLEQVQMSSEHTLIDGYQLANKLNLKPTKPAFKLKQPLTPTK